LWRSNIAVDQQLPWWGLVGTAEFIYGRDVNGIYYINANLAAPNSSFVGADNRPRWTAIAGDPQPNRINNNITSAIVLKNQNEGYNWNFAAALERSFSNGLFAKAAYSYGVSKNTVDPGSIAFGSWNNNQHSGDPNNPGVAFSINSPTQNFCKRSLTARNTSSLARPPCPYTGKVLATPADPSPLLPHRQLYL
jgi:hypothetical protein